MLSQAGRGHGAAAGRTRQLLHDEGGAAFFPGPHRARLILHPHLDVVMAGCRAGVAATQGTVADLATGRTAAGMAVVPEIMSRLT
jgi:hypothetical protein